MVPQRLMNIQSTARVLVFAIVSAYCLCSPARAQTANPQAQNPQVSNQSQGSSPALQPAQPSQQPPASEGSAHPAPSGADSQPVQQPVTTYLDAAGAPQQPQTQQSGQSQSEPQGAAAAEKVNTAGGAAAKPAGVAIAPAKQHQTRSLLIKIGAFVAGGAAAGTVYALSRGTSSTPPGATSPSAVKK